MITPTARSLPAGSIVDCTEDTPLGTKCIAFQPRSATLRIAIAPNLPVTPEISTSAPVPCSWISCESGVGSVTSYEAP